MRCAWYHAMQKMYLQSVTKFFEKIVKHTLDNKYIEVQVTRRKQYILKITKDSRYFFLMHR